MKKLSLVVGLIVLIGATAASAAERRVPVEVSGTMTNENGVSRLTAKNFLVNPGDRLVLSTDDDLQVARFEEWSADLTHPVDVGGCLPCGAGVAQSTFFAVIHHTSVDVASCNMEAAQCGVLTSIGDYQLGGAAAADSSGRLLLHGSGVWNDTLHGNPAKPNILVRFEVRQTGPAISFSGSCQ